MSGKEFIKLVQGQMRRPGQNLKIEIVANPGLWNNTAMYAFKEDRLYVSRSAEKLLLDPDTFEDAMDNLRIIPVPRFIRLTDL